MFTMVITKPITKKKNKFYVRNDKNGKFVFESWAKHEAIKEQIRLTDKIEATRLAKNAKRRELAKKKAKLPKAA